MKFDVTINTDDKYIQHAMATLCSLYENNIDHDITVHVLQKNLSDKSKECLTSLATRYNNVIYFYSVDESKLQGVQFRKNRPLSMAAYYRLLLSSVLPDDIEKVLYLDCDMIVLRDISEVFSIEIDNYALAATLDIFPYDQQHRLQLHMEVGEKTFCSGIMLVNLNYWRKHNVEDDLLEYAKRKRDVVYLHDQDVLNYLFKKRWFVLPPKWNRVACSLRPVNREFYPKFDRKEYAEEPMLFHYASLDVKPWYNAPSPEKSLYVQYLQMSNFADISLTKVSLTKKIRLSLLTFKYMVKKEILKITGKY